MHFAHFRGPALATWGYVLAPSGISTLVTEHHQDHRPRWLIASVTKGLMRVPDPDAHYLAGMTTTLEALARAAESR